MRMNVHVAFYMPDDAAKLAPHTLTEATRAPSPLAPGWAASDVALLDELAGLGMDLARTLTKQVIAHDAACERG